jgi:aldose 1-epimerase
VRALSPPAPAVRPSVVEGLDAVDLIAGPLEATFVPAAGMAGASLRHAGEELLDRRDGVLAYAATGATMGIPFLHPWANRLAGDRYAVDGVRVELPRDLPRDPAGLPIHGVLPARWRLVSAGAAGERASVLAACEVDHPAFPFPHRVEQRIALGPAALRIETVVRATGAASVPLAFGFHPYLRLPGVPRAAWTVSLPARRRLLTDDRLIPTGATAPEPAATVALGGRAFDHGYDELGARPSFALAGGGRRITVAFLTGYPVAQVYAPPDAALVSFEPMTAPANALVSGDGLRLLAPGERFAAAFEIRVE